MLGDADTECAQPLEKFLCRRFIKRQRAIVEMNFSSAFIDIFYVRDIFNVHDVGAVVQIYSFEFHGNF